MRDPKPAPELSYAEGFSSILAWYDAMNGKGAVEIIYDVNVASPPERVLYMLVYCFDNPERAGLLKGGNAKPRADMGLKIKIGLRSAMMRDGDGEKM